jgi:hypothetical protein
MSGPIVRTGASPEFSKNWDRIFGGKTRKQSAAKSTASKSAGKTASKSAKAAKKSAKAAKSSRAKKK